MGKIPNTAWQRMAAPIFMGTLLAIAAGWAYTLKFIDGQEADAVAHQVADNINLAKVHSEQMVQVLRDVEFQGTALAGRATRGQISATSFAAEGKALQALLPYVRQIQVSDAGGNVRLSTLGSHSGNDGDQPHFKAHVGGDQRGLYIGAPMQSGPGDAPVLPLSVRIADATGAFSGVVTLAIDTGHFSRLYGSTLARGDVLSVVRTDGVVLLSGGSPQGQPEIGSNISDRPRMKEALQQSAGFFVSTGAVGGAPRVTAFERAGSFPVLVRISTPLSEVLAPVQQSKVLYFASAGGVTLLLLAGSLFFVYALQRQASYAAASEQSRLRAEKALGEKIAVEAELQASEARYRTVVEDQSEMICRFRSDGTMIFANRAFRSRFGSHIEGDAGKKWLAMVLAEDRHIVESAITNQEPVAKDVTFEFRARDTSGGVRWIQAVRHSNFDELGRLLEWQVVGRDITEIREIVERDRRNTLRLQLALEAGSIGVYERDFIRNEVIWDKRIYDMWGLPPGSPLSLETSLSGIHPEDRERVRQAIARRVDPNGDGRYEMDYRVVGIATGIERWIHVAGRVVFKDGKPERYIGIAMDITERKRSQDALRESEERIQRILAASPDGLMTYRHGRIEYVNDALLRMLGYDTPAQLIGRDMAELFPIEVAPQLTHFIESGTRGTPASINPIKIVHREGPLIPVEVAASSLKDDHSLRILVVRDISARLRADEALRRGAEEFQALITTAEDGFWVLSETGRLQEVNQRYCTLSGYNRSELLAMPSIDRLVATNDTGLVQERLARVKELGTARFESAHRHKDGHPIDVEITATFLPRSGLIFAFIRDITERKQFEEARMRSQRLESLGTLAGGIAHDFNNVLSAVIGFADMAAEEIGAGHPALESIDRIRAAGVRASELVRRIMAFGRPQKKEQRVAHVGELVHEVLKLLRATIRTTVNFRVDIEPDAPPIHADPSQVHEAIVNLANNAAYAIGASAGTIAFEVRRTAFTPERAAALGLAPGLYTCLTVKDTGCGMSAETLARIFDVFYTTKPIGEGSGLGLSMVHGIVRSHGGAVTVESEPGMGSSFHLYFPAAPGTGPTQANAVVPHATTQAPKRVLYVDDEEALVLLTTRTLRRMGHEVSGYTDPTDALAEFQLHPDRYDLVLTDLSMPGMSGIDLARKILAVRSDVPVLLASGYLRAEDEGNIRAAGVRELLHKPLTLVELTRVLERLFGDAQKGKS